MDGLTASACGGGGYTDTQIDHIANATSNDNLTVFDVNPANNIEISNLIIGDITADTGSDISEIQAIVIIRFVLEMVKVFGNLETEIIDI